MTLIQTTSENDAEGFLAEVYAEITGAIGTVPGVFQAASLAPKILKAHWRLHRELLSDPAPLSPSQRELIGLTVSQANNCHY
jgi:alkylhydroperoxidase family enzyme